MKKPKETHADSVFEPPKPVKQPEKLVFTEINNIKIKGPVFNVKFPDIPENEYNVPSLRREPSF